MVAGLLHQLVEEVAVRAEGEQVVGGVLHKLVEEAVEQATEAAIEVPVTRWGCEVCGKEFWERRQLYLHTRHHHVDPGDCDICNKPFPSNVKLMRHMQTKHMEQPDRAFICTGCGHIFKDGSNFRRHVANVCGIEKVKKPKKKKDFSLQCDLCDNKYKHHRTLTEHQRKKHGCGQESAMAVASIIAELLLGVQQQVTDEVADPVEGDGGGGGGGGEGEPAQFNCNICNKTFTKKQSLSTHKGRIHNAVKHRCLLCGDTFSQSSNLKVAVMSNAVVYCPSVIMHVAKWF